MRHVRAAALIGWLASAVLAASCTFDWDYFDPRVETAGQGGAGGGAECAIDGTPCGDGTSTACDLADTCLAGTCAPNPAPADETCGDASATACSAPDSCDGQGQCDPRHAADGTACDDCASGICAGCAMGACVECTTNAELTTLFNSDLGTDGVMFDIVATTAVKIVSFDTNLLAGTYEMAVYYRAGGYTGFDNDAGAWTLVGTVANVVSTAQDVATPVPLAIDVIMPAGATYGWYVTSTAGGGGTDQVMYRTGTAEGAVQVGDAHVQILEGRAKEYPFAMPFFPRQWNGIVHYTSCE